MSSEHDTQTIAGIRVFHDVEGRSLVVWFDDPATEEFCEELDDDLVLMKDKSSRIIGFEQLNWTPPCVPATTNP